MVFGIRDKKKGGKKGVNKRGEKRKGFSEGFRRNLGEIGVNILIVRY